MGINILLPYYSPDNRSETLQDDHPGRLHRRSVRRNVGNSGDKDFVHNAALTPNLFQSLYHNRRKYCDCWSCPNAAEVRADF